MHLKKLLLLSTLFLTQTLQAQHVIDLTYPYDENTIYWPTETGFHLTKEAYGMNAKGYFYSASRFSAPEHGGTHIDAPRHFSKNDFTVDQIPVSTLVGNAVVIDVRKQVKNNPDYAITVNDIQQFEKKHHALSSQDIVFFYTGFGSRWPDKKAYLGSDKPGDVAHLHFPGISKEAATYLVKKNVKGLGIDTASMDPGVETQFWAHRVILGSNRFGLENVAHLDLLPVTGATVVVAPMKIAGGSGGPTRIFALLPRSSSTVTNKMLKIGHLSK